MVSGFLPIWKSSSRSLNCPWMSPHTVTGARTDTTLGSLIRISLACSEEIDFSFQDSVLNLITFLDTRHVMPGLIRRSARHGHVENSNHEGQMNLLCQICSRQLWLGSKQVHKSVIMDSLCRTEAVHLPLKVFHIAKAAPHANLAQTRAVQATRRLLRAPYTPHSRK